MVDISYDTPLRAMRGAIQPVGDEHSEPVVRLLHSLQSGKLTLIVKQDGTVPEGWLTADRIENTLRDLPIEALPIRVWPLLRNACVLSFLSSSDPASPDAALGVQLVRRLLLEQLELQLTVEQPAKDEAAEQQALHFEAIPIIRPAFSNEQQSNLAALDELLMILINRQLRVQFQPIISLKDGTVFAYEALIRGPKGNKLARPAEMLATADKASMLSWFDIACQEQCLAQAATRGIKQLLFINMDPEGLAYMDLYDYSLASKARGLGLTPSRIVVEITERQTMEDFPNTLKYLHRLREEGFKIAIDDAGAGYNSLNTIAELRPEFVKVDREVVRNLDVHGPRKALLDTLVKYSRKIGTAVLGEGAESREELCALIDMGVTYCQGYVVGKPADNFHGVPREMREFIRVRAQQYQHMVTGSQITVGGIARRGMALPAETTIGTVIRLFQKEEGLTSIIVAEKEKPLGILMRNQLDIVMTMTKAAMAGSAFVAEIIGQWMSTSFLEIDDTTSVTEAAELVTSRTDVSLDHDIILVTGDKKYSGVISVRELIASASAGAECRLRHTDPLTGLPGRVALEQALSDRLEHRQPIAMVLADIDRMEQFNQQFGVPHGDSLIRDLGRRIDKIRLKMGGPGDFLAHLGGDDFYLLTDPDRVQAICEEIDAQFRDILSRFYTPKQLRLKMSEYEAPIVGRRNVPIASISVVAQTNQRRKIGQFWQVMDMLADQLRSSRRQSGIRIMIDGTVVRIENVLTGQDDIEMDQAA